MTSPVAKTIALPPVRLERTRRVTAWGGAPVAAARRRPDAWATLFAIRLAFTDTLLIAAVVAGATVLAADQTATLPLAVATAIGWSISLGLHRTRAPRIVGAGSGEYRRVFGASMTTFGAVAAAGIAFGIEIDRTFFILSLLGGTAALVVTRWGWRQWLIAERKRGGYRARAVLLGEAAEVDAIAARLAGDPSAAYEVAGAIVPDAPIGSSTPTMRIPVCGAVDAVPDAVQLTGSDAVLVCSTPHDDAGFLQRLGWDLESTSAELIVSSGLTDIAGPRITVRPVEGMPFMHVERPYFEGGKHIVKRAFDIAVAAVALVLLAPVFAVIAVLVRHDSDGPAIFRQRRVGRGGTTFTMLKFRTMHVNAEEALATLLDENDGAGPLFKLHDDPRVTRIGRVLRRYSLDELPQLVNVLLGQMSLVGPRPPLPREVDEYGPHVHRRLYTRPGITGLWQVNGRSDLDWEESVRLDLSYVENLSITGDLVILWRTAKVVLNPRGAY